MNKYLKFIFVFAEIALIFLMANCGKPPAYRFIPSLLKLQYKPPVIYKVNTADELAFASEDDYNNNQFGLITGKTLNTFAQNWDTKKPVAVTGKLVVIQVQTSATNSNRYIPANPSKGVYSYLLNYSITDQNSIFAQTRNDAINSIETMVPEGKVVDAFLSAYGINPAADLIVFAMDTSSSANLWYALRGYYALRYWGIDKRNIAFLNGSIEQNVSLGEIFTVLNRNTEVKQESASIKGLLVDNTILQATLADVIHIVLNGNTSFEKVTSIPTGGILLLDARSATEFNPTNQNGQTLAPLGKSCAAGANCKAPIDGRIKGAVNLEWVNLLRDTASNDFRFKTKSEINSIFKTSGSDGNKQIIVYSRSGLRAMIPLFASISILGNGARVFDGSWIEWSSMAVDNNQIWSNLIASSPWRTDKATLTDGLTYTSPATMIPIYTLPTTSQFGTNSNKIIDDDKNYIRGVGSSGGSGGGGSSGGGGGNACGG
jgi:thiosulfate/3-mercaptopyruvate sulfurtransferase